MQEKENNQNCLWFTAFCLVGSNHCVNFVHCCKMAGAILSIDLNHHKCEKFNHNCQHMKHVTKQMKCGKYVCLALV